MQRKVPQPMIPVDGFRSAVQALQGLDPASQERILQDILKRDPKMAARLTESLFVFSDLQYLLPTDFKVIWWEIPKDRWFLALRNADKSIWDMIQAKISNRAFADLKESVQTLGPQPLSKVQAAQREICDFILKMSAEGRMALPRAAK